MKTWKLFGLLVTAILIGAGSTWFALVTSAADAAQFNEPPVAAESSAPSAPAAVPVVPAGIRRPWQGTGTLTVSAYGIPAGAYIVTAEGGADGCYWARLSRNDADESSIIAQGHFDRGGYAKPIIHPHDRYFRIQGCSVDALS